MSFIQVLEGEKYIFYYCILEGPFNLIFMTYQPIDVSHLKGYKRTVISGVHSNYIVPQIQQQSYDTAFEKIQQRSNAKIEESMIGMVSKNTKWTPELWELFQDMKYNLSMDFTPLVKKYGFKSTTFYERLKKLFEMTDTYVPLYPLGEKSYLYFNFLIKTNYQQFIIESFSELPVFTTHLRIKDSLLSRVPIPYGMEKEHFLNIFSLWERKGIIDSHSHSIPYHSDILHPGIPCPAPSPPPKGITTVSGEGRTEKVDMFSI